MKNAKLAIGASVLALFFAVAVKAQNVGIGVSNPLSKLTVNGNLAVGSGYNVAAPTNGAIIQGNVGIGTTNPAYQLHVANFGGEARAALEGNNTGIGALLYLMNDSSSSKEVTIDMTSPGGGTGFQLSVDLGATNTNNFSIYDNENDDYPFFISHNDQVGLSNLDPRFKLDVNGIVAVASGIASISYPTTQNSLALGWDVVQPGSGIAEFVNYSGTGGGNAFDFFRVPNSGVPTTSTIIADIDTAGGYHQVSDQRVKTDIRPLRYGLREIMSLEPKEYDIHPVQSMTDGKPKFAAGATHQLGFLAQQVVEVLPEAIEKPADSKTDLYRMGYTNFIPVLVSAVQELKHLQDEKAAEQQTKLTQAEAKISEQDIEITAFKSEIAELKQANTKLLSMAARLESLQKAVDTIQRKQNGQIRKVTLEQ